MSIDANPALSRRAVVGGACGAACLLALTACSGYGSGESARPAPGNSGGVTTGGGAGSAGGALAATADIPVGGGVIFADQDVVVTQPVAGEFKAFTATCTHQGCVVDEVDGGTINCPCHGSKFAVADGSVTDGPASSPLAEKAITVQGTSIMLA
ncbi:MAG: Rieske (2Fe-2S) protein [Pseudonocardia sp.]